ncbi:STAS domain-containing protein [Actinoplanes sp. CA-252034]|uniref:STAS domain-containing protein n=1 Tax=Actinoplanes sp. CA-252034 TaxID=3239906 RepID=UPI003D99EB78
MSEVVVDLRLASRAGESCTVVEVGGQLDMDTVPQLDGFLRDVADDGAARVVLDLTDVSFLDSSGLGLLVAWLKELSAAGGWLRLAGVQQLVAYVLQVSAVDRAVDRYASVAAAEASGPPLPS